MSGDFIVKSPTRPNRVLAWATNPVCALYRLQAPLKALEREGLIELHLTNRFDDQSYQMLLNWADVFIIQRARVDDTLRAVISAAKNAGVRVVYEIDDDLLALAQCPSLTGMMESQELEAIEQGMILADVIHVSTPILGERYATYGEIRVLPNGFPVTPPPLTTPSPQRESIEIFYGAGRWHKPDWAYVVEELDQALRVVSEKEKLSVMVTLMGATWALPQGSDSLRYQTLPAQPWPSYLTAINKADIALMPLEPNRHTEAKSTIKFLESAAMGTAAVGLGPIYAEVIQHQRTGMLATTPSEFAHLVAELSLSPQKRQSLRKDAHHWLSNHGCLEHRLSAWRNAFS